MRTSYQTHVHVYKNSNKTQKADADLWQSVTVLVFTDTWNECVAFIFSVKRFFSHSLTHEDPKGSEISTTLLWKPQILPGRYSAHDHNSHQSLPHSPVLQSLPWGVWSTVDENAVSKISASEVGLPTTPCPEYDLACADSHGRCLEVGAGAVTRSPMVHTLNNYLK
jgi:hypothetical protein